MLVNQIGYQSKFGTEARLQLNDKFSEVSDIN